MEKDLLSQLKKNLDEKLNFKSLKNIKHVDEIDKNNINIKGMDFESMHKIHPETVEYKDKYFDNYSKTDLPKVTSSDPYNEIFGGRYSS
jgi:hypothetical protein